MLFSFGFLTGSNILFLIYYLIKLLVDQLFKTLNKIESLNLVERKIIQYIIQLLGIKTIFEQMLQKNKSWNCRNQ